MSPAIEQRLGGGDKRKRERRDELNGERSAFATKMAESADRSNMEIELRTRALERAKVEALEGHAETVAHV